MTLGNFQGIVAVVLHIVISVAAVEALAIVWLGLLVWQKDRQYHKEVWECRRQSQSQRVGWKAKERDLVEKLATREKEILAEHRVRESELLQRLVDLASRPQPEPIVIDTSKAVTAIGEAISRVISGPPEVAAARAQADQAVAEQWRESLKGQDPLGQPYNTPYPEMDEWMNPPDRTNPASPPPEVNGNSVMAAASYWEGQHQNGSVRLSGRMGGTRPGQPIEFKSGEGGAPPTGGFEY